MAKHIAIRDFTYALPEDRIAQYPLADRAASKLLLYNKGEIADRRFYQLPELLPKDTLLIFNTTRVVSARILFPIVGKNKPIEIFVLEPADTITIEEAMHQQEHAKWKCLVGNNRYFTMDRLERTFMHHGVSHHVYIDKPTQVGDVFIVQFSWTAGVTFSELLDNIGKIPIPPYMQRPAADDDNERYQTVYAQEEGSVAAPTAGLHFTDGLMHALQQNGVHNEHVVLHIGAGTFRPVKAATMEGHDMHAEEISVTLQTIDALMQQVDRIVAVGTTSLRTLESLFWIGLKWAQQESMIIPEVLQWDAYDLQVPANFTYADALEVISRHMQKLSIETLTTKTQLLIAPGYTIRSAKGLITNFHQPNSTLLLLVATFVGGDWKRIYDHALKNQYRFLSYGDSSLLWRE